MKIYEMLFQVTPWEVYQEFYDLDDQKARQSFCETIIQLNEKEVSHLIQSNHLGVDQA